MTTQNRSGLGSPVESFLSLRPFPLSLQRCRDSGEDVAQHIYSALEQAARRMRRWKLIAGAANKNLRILEAGGWNVLSDWADRLWEQRQAEARLDHYKLERDAAKYLQSTLHGFGPKQSRNFWQSLLLTRYEFPVDSRILRWCSAKLDLELPTQGLADEAFYELIMDSFRDLCWQADIWPSVFDAAIFATYERDDGVPRTTAYAEDSDDE
jgi:hypothetical protein